MLHLLLIGGTLVIAGVKVLRQHVQEQEQKLTHSEVIPEETAAQLQRRDQETMHYIKVSGAAMGVAVVGEFLFPPLVVVSIPLNLYTAFPVFEVTFKNLLVERKVRASAIDSIAIAGALSTHYYVAAAFANQIYFLAQKLLIETEDKSKQQIINIFGKQPRTVWLLQNGVEVEIPFENLNKDDVIVINTGEVVPIDGWIIAGSASVDQHMLTGESQPVEKSVDDQVFAATLLIGGKIQVRVEKTGQETVAASIGEILRKTSNFRASIESRAVALADKLALPTLGVSALALVKLSPVSAVAVTSCNFSEIVRIVSPIGVLNHLSLASKQGILIKDGRSLELLGSVDTVVFDKTGTLTLEQPHLGAIHVWNSLTENEVLILAAAAEHRQTHPIARAIQQAAIERELNLPAVDQARYEIGYGIKVYIDGKTVRVGSARFMVMEQLPLPPTAEILQSECHNNGYSLVFLGLDDQIVGALELHTTIRPEATWTLRRLRERGLDVYIISGDHAEPTRKLAQALGINNYFADTLPEDKAKHIERLQAQGKSVCFVGDGINDTIAMKKAQVSISLSGATTAATDTAGIIFMDQSLKQLVPLFELSTQFDTNMKTGFAVSLGPGLVGIAGVFLLHFGIYSTLVLYVLALGTGVTNAMWPLLSPSRTRDTTPSSVFTDS
ncbi:MAG: heavy metal translocating P-type ATPase [Thioploca sp.]|nr:heavy metal translocating P-type ATPase [Thioploca sp.]